MARAAAVLVLLLVCVSAAAASASSPFSRHLLQQPASTNCTPPRPLNATKLPFCFQPDTISAAARQFLSQAAAGASPLAFDTTLPQETLAAQIQKADAFLRKAYGQLHEAAVRELLQSVRNDSIGNVSVLIAVPKGVKQGPPANTKVLLYLHGGGFALGSCHYQLNTAAATAANAGLTIICPEYRLAPEHPFPAGLNDVLTVYKTMIKQGGYKPGNIVLLGDSAGGTFVAAMAVQLQREGVALPAALGMFSPFADAHTRGDTHVTMVAVDPLLTGVDPAHPTQQGGLISAYVGGNVSLFDDPLVSPVYADFARLFPRGALPPTLIQVGLRETLLSDSVRLYHKMRAAAPAPGHVVLSPYEGMWHVWQSFINVPEAAAASREMGEYFSRALAGHICK